MTTISLTPPLHLLKTVLTAPVGHGLTLCLTRAGWDVWPRQLMQEPRNRGEVYGVADTETLMEWVWADEYPTSRESLAGRAEYVADNIRDWIEATLDITERDEEEALCRDLLAALRA